MINVSAVLYQTDEQQVMLLLRCLVKAPNIGRIFLVDNSPKPTERYKTLPAPYEQKVEYIFCNKNLGYGAAHNIAIRKTIEQCIDYHLVLNTDIEFDADILSELEQYMQQHGDVGQVMPKILYPDGTTQYLCKLLPTPLDLFGRRFLPKQLFQTRTERFELRSSGYDKVMNVPYLSGCFMLLRTEALGRVGLFDERFFMYPEDIDLTRRMHRHFLTIFYPYVSVVHRHERGSYKSFRMLWIHIVNICRYFNKWGWFFDAERYQINRATLQANTLSED